MTLLCCLSPLITFEGTHWPRHTQIGIVPLQGHRVGLQSQAGEDDIFWLGLLEKMFSSAFWTLGCIDTRFIA